MRQSLTSGPKVGLLHYLVAALWFLVMTKTEFPGQESASGLSLLLRLSAGAGLLVVYWFTAGAPPGKTVALASLFAASMLLINMGSLGPLAVIAVGCVGLGVLIADLMVRRPDLLIFSCRTYLILNVVALFLALALYYRSGELVDLHSAIFPWSDAREGRLLGVVRVTGIQVEPGTYSNIIYITVLISSLVRRRIFGLIEAIAMCSTIATLAAWSAVGVGIYFLAAFVEKNRDLFSARDNANWLSTILSVFILILAFGWITQAEQAWLLDYMSSRLSPNGAGSTQLKVYALEKWQEKLWLEMAVPHSMADEFCTLCESPQDLGLGFNLVYHLGLVFSFCLAAFCSIRAFSSFGLALITLLLGFMATKVYFYDPSVWAVIGYLILAPQASFHFQKPLLIHQNARRRARKK